MFAIAAFGVVILTLGVFMVARPVTWGQSILLFSRTPHFHAAEIGLRVLMGILLVTYAGQTRHPGLFSSLGYLMFGVAAFLVAIGEARHRRFAVRSSSFIRIFRPGGLLAIGFGVFTLVSCIGG